MTQMYVEISFGGDCFSWIINCLDGHVGDNLFCFKLF